MITGKHDGDGDEDGDGHGDGHGVGMGMGMDRSLVLTGIRIGPNRCQYSFGHSQT